MKYFIAIGLLIGAMELGVYVVKRDLALSQKMVLCYYAGEQMFPVYQCELVPRGKGW